LFQSINKLDSFRPHAFETNLPELELDGDNRPTDQTEKIKFKNIFGKPGKYQ
jgi:hypothetical protein